MPDTSSSDKICNPCDSRACCLATCATYVCSGPLVSDADQVCGATPDNCDEATCCVTRRERRRRRRERRRRRRFGLAPNATPADNLINTEEIMFLQGNGDGFAAREQEGEGEDEL